MMSKFVVYLGGSITQSVNFEYFKKKKIKVILIDQNPNCFCRKYCDIFLNISQKDVNKILLNLEKILKKNKKIKIIDCFGIAHYSYEAINAIKLKYIKNSVDDKFLKHKYIQKKLVFPYGITPEYMMMPDKKKLIDKSNKSWNKIYEFYKKNNFNIYIKSDGMHQGQGIINLNQKVSKTIFIKKYSKKILDLIKKNIKIYCERKAIGKLINIDFVKKKDGSVIFLPLILRDKVILKGKKKFLSVFQYVDNSKIINEYYYKLLTKIIKQTYKNISVFGTIDAIINKDQFQILEWSPHFHNIKIFKFLYDVDIIDIYFDKNNKKDMSSDKNLGGYIFIHDENKETLKLRRYVEKNSKKVLIDYIDTEKRKDFLKKHAFIKKNFHIIYFKSNSIKDLLKISKYLENNKIRLYN